MILQITNQAKEDLSEIAFYTFVNFGERQMNAYRNQFKTDFQRILKNPFIGTQRMELGDTIYGLVSGSHVVFYSIEAHSIQIIKIIHGSCDVPKAFY